MGDTFPSQVASYACIARQMVGKGNLPHYSVMFLKRIYSTLYIIYNI
nr:MAG TPA: hypothetical protein [Caudoviricetes sp.]